MATNFNITIRLVAMATGDAVTFKQDGQRFDQAATIKLNADTVYEFRVTLRPAISLEKLMINGENCTLVVAKGGDDSDSKTYSAKYCTTGYDVSKNGGRKEITLHLEFQNGAYVRTTLQCKMYESGETSHSQWGQKLSAIDMDCRREEGRDYIIILKEKYL